MPLSPSQFNGLVKIYQDNIDSMIDNLGKSVVLHFKDQVSNITKEDNDFVRDQDSRRPIYKNPSTNPTITTTEKEILALIEYQPKNFETFGLKIEQDQTIIQLKTYLSYSNDLQKCEYITPSPEISPLIYGNYKLLRGIIPTGIKTPRYCISFWTSI